MVQMQTCFHTLVLTCRTGWALTLLSEENLSYASTCQTIGLNTGYFASFTVFLALSSEAFRYGLLLDDGFYAFIDRTASYLARDGAYRCYLLARTFVSGVRFVFASQSGSRSSKRRCVFASFMSTRLI
jgi:hypothetical protein